MKNKLYYLMLLVLAAITASCGGNEFKIDMDIANVDGQGVKVIFRGDSGVVDDWATTEKKGRFSYKGGRPHQGQGRCCLTGHYQGQGQPRERGLAALSRRTC